MKKGWGFAAVGFCFLALMALDILPVQGIAHARGRGGGGGGRAGGGAHMSRGGGFSGGGSVSHSRSSFGGGGHSQGRNYGGSSRNFSGRSQFSGHGNYGGSGTSLAERKQDLHSHVLVSGPDHRPGGGPGNRPDRPDLGDRPGLGERPDRGNVPNNVNQRQEDRQNYGREIQDNRMDYADDVRGDRMAAWGIATLTNAALGSYYYSLPLDCVEQYGSAYRYYVCSDGSYRPYYYQNQLVYTRM